MAYPVYLTIGNLPKSIRHKPSQQGQILLAYLPCTHLMHITNKAARRHTQANLFHAAMGYILEPLKGAGIQGIEIASGDGVIHRGHPILAAYVGNYPEQCLVTGAFTGDCPGCDCPRNELETTHQNIHLRTLMLCWMPLSSLALLNIHDYAVKPISSLFNTPSGRIFHMSIYSVQLTLISYINSTRVL
jgi:hypothetical protein